MGARLASTHASQFPRVGRRHPWRWVSLVVVVLACLLFARALATNGNLDWTSVGHYLFNDAILSGVTVTIELTLICQTIGILLGTALALGRVGDNPVAQGIAAGYSWLFRGTPVLVQLIFWYNLALLFPRIGVGIPFTSLWVSANTNAVITSLTASIIGLGLNEAAYMSEIIRAGIDAVDAGQTEAALAMGMRRWQTMCSIVLPQALRTIVPPTGNQLIQMLKATSLVAFIAGGDLLTRAEGIYSDNFEVIPLLIVATLWYLSMTTVATVVEQVLERRFARGVRRRGNRGRFLKGLLGVGTGNS